MSQLKQYKDLDLHAIMEAEGLDFAHFTYPKNMCSCCYGPLDMSARYWRDGCKPALVGPEGTKHYEMNGERISTNDITYILFKNAYNGSGSVTKNDYIKDNTCISYQLHDMQQAARVSNMLQEQLGEGYRVVAPPNEHTCIIIYKNKQ